MAHHFHAARWQNYPARRVGPAHLSRIIRATVGEDLPDYQDLEARRQIRYSNVIKPARATNPGDSDD